MVQNERNARVGGYDPEHNPCRTVLIPILIPTRLGRLRPRRRRREAVSTIAHANRSEEELPPSEDLHLLDPRDLVSAFVSKEGVPMLCWFGSSVGVCVATAGKLPPANNERLRLQGDGGLADQEHWVRFEDFRVFRMPE